MALDSFVGEIMLFAGAQEPAGWMICDGRMLSIQGNEMLYAVIGNRYGNQTPTHFAIPDMRRYLPSGALSMNDSGKYTGKPSECTVELVEENLPSHSHKGSFVGDPIQVTTNMALLVKKRPASGVTEGTVDASAGGYIGEGPSSGVLAGAVFVSSASTAKTVALAPMSATALGTPTGTVALGNTGGGKPFSIPIPMMTINFLICINGVYPSPA